MIAVGEVVFHGDETPWSFLSRVASDYMMTLEQFCEYKGVSSDRLTTGNAASLAKLLDQWHVDPTPLVVRSSKKNRSDQRWIGDTTNSYRRLKLQTSRHCPHCLASDYDNGTGKRRTRPYQRLAWLSPYVDRCHVHNARLHDFEVLSDGAGGMDFSQNFHLNAQSVAIAVKADVRVDPSAASDYFAGRMMGRSAGHVLDSLPTFRAADACMAFGDLEDFARDLETLATYRARNLVRGFETISAGKEAMTAFLDARVNRPFVGMPTPLRLYGSALEFARACPEAHTFRDIVREHGFEHLPLGAGETFLGAARTDRKIHSLWSLARQSGLTGRQVAGLLTRNGLMEKDTPYRQVLVDAAAAEAIVAGVATTRISLKRLTEETGLTVLLAKRLVAKGVLPHAGPTTKLEFDQADVDAFFARLKEKLVKRRRPEKNVVNIHLAHAATKVPKEDIIMALVVGTVEGFLPPGELSDIGQITLRLKDVELMMPKKATGDMPAYAVERYLRVSTGTVPMLMARQYIKAIRRPLGTYAAVEDVQAFHQRYIALNEIRGTLGAKMATLKGRLHDVGLEIAIEPERPRVATFYLRAEFMEKLDRLRGDG